MAKFRPSSHLDSKKPVPFGHRKAAIIFHASSTYWLKEEMKSYLRLTHSHPSLVTHRAKIRHTTVLPRV